MVTILGGADSLAKRQTTLDDDNPYFAPSPLYHFQIVVHPGAGMMGATPQKYSFKLIPLGAERTNVKLVWLDAAGNPHEAEYKDVQVSSFGSKTSAALQGAPPTANFEIDPSSSDVPVIRDAAGNPVYPSTDSTLQDFLGERQTVNYLFPPGLQMVTLPGDNPEEDLATLLGMDPLAAKIARWNPEAPTDNKYALYPSLFASTPLRGAGLWAKFDRTTPVSLTVRRDQSPFSIFLKPGWNQIGNPKDVPLTWDLTALRVRRGNQEMTLAQAQQAGWIEDFAWGFQQNADKLNTGNYVLIYDGSIIPGVLNQRAAWTGCWMKAYVDCELIVPPPSANSSSLSRALSQRKPTRNEWLVTLSAETFGVKDSVSFGASLVGRSGNKLQIAKPPAAPGQTNFEVFLVSADRAATGAERLGADASS